MRLWEWGMGGRLLRYGNSLNRVFSRLSLLGISLVVAGFVLTSTVLNGFDAVYTKALVHFNGSAVLFKEGGIGADDPAFGEIESVKKIDPELQAIPFYYGETLLLGAGGMKGVQLKVIDEELFETAISRYSRGDGNESKEGRREGVYLGAMLARSLGRSASSAASPGSVRILTTDRQAFSTSEELFVAFPVAGVFETGLSEFDGSFILMKRADYEQLGGETTSFQGVEFFSSEGILRQSTLDALREGFSFPYTFLDWQELNGTFFEALKTERTVFLLIASAIMGIAVLNVMILTAIQMVERTREWRLLEVLGAPLSMRRRLFFKPMFALVFFGLLLGFAIAVLAIFLVTHVFPISLPVELYFIDTLPLTLEPKPFLYSALVLLPSAALAIFLSLSLGKFLQRQYRLH